MNPELEAATKAAQTARAAANSAKQAAEAAGGTDEALNTALTSAESAATEADQKVTALSQNPNPDLKKSKVDKIDNRMRILAEERKRLTGEESPAAAAEDLTDISDIVDDPLDLEPEDAPVTVGMLRKRDARAAGKTAEQMIMANITDPEQQATALKHLKDTVKLTGNAEADYRNVLTLTFAAKNTQVIEEVQRRQPARTTVSGAGNPPRVTPQEPEFTKEEQDMMRAPFNLSKAQVLAARVGDAALRGSGQ